MASLCECWEKSREIFWRESEKNEESNTHCKDRIWHSICQAKSFTLKAQRFIITFSEAAGDSAEVAELVDA
jgi:hypothetical protein